MNRRNFIRVAGGGIVVAAATGAAGVYALRSDYPAASVEAWQGPGVERDPRRRALAYAITAPNPHNLQPWKVDLREPDVITLSADRTRLLPETDPFGRQILIGHGAFLELLVIALAQEGLSAQVKLWPQGELPDDLKAWDGRPVARITLTRGSTPDPLFAQILKRHTPKSDFDVARPVSLSIVESLVGASRRPGLTAAGTVEAAQLGPLRELCLQSAMVELRTPHTMMESVRLIRVGPEEILRHRDGITINTPMIRAIDAIGLFDRSAPPAEGSPAFKNATARFEGHSRTAMGFVWLATTGNSRSQQVDTGRTYVRLQLKATELGVGVHPMSQALQEFKEMQPHYERAHRLMIGKPAPKAAVDETLQMFARIGYTAGPAPATPRRELSQIVV